MEKEKLWKSVVGELELAISPTYYNTFFPGTKITKVDNKNKSIEVMCPSKISRDTIASKYKDEITNLIYKRQKEQYTISFVTSNKQSNDNKPTSPLFSSVVNNNNINTDTSVKEDVKKAGNKVGLIDDYTFKNFIVGPNNRLAYTVAKSVADSPGTTYNPFLIYSNVGLGKTHLLQAIGNEIAINRPDLKILYCTGQDFLNELMEEMQTYRNKGGTLGRFKAKFTNNDVWLIDDVQHIAGRDTTQEEFYFAFNNLYLNKKQIVLSTDRHPSEIPKLESRISSRFSMGMIADMQMPDVDVRSAILRAKAKKMKIDITNETLDYIAENISTNVRELEGAFIQAITYSKAMGVECNVKTVQEALGKTIVQTFEKNVKPTKVVSEIASFFNIEVREIKGKKRTKDIVKPRHISMYLLKEINQLPLKEIGEILGGRDHTTVMHGVEKVTKDLENGDFRLKRQISEIKEVILTKK